MGYFHGIIYHGKLREIMILWDMLLFQMLVFQINEKILFRWLVGVTIARMAMHWATCNWGTPKPTQNLA